MLDQKKRHEQIKQRLRQAGTSLADVARELEVRPTTVTSVSQGFRRSRRIEHLIAAKLSTSPAKLWPDRYGDEQRDSYAGGGSPSPRPG